MATKEASTTLVADRLGPFDRLRLLAEATVRLDATLDLDATVEATAAIAVPALGDWCFIDLVEASKHYPHLKKQWVEFLGERPDKETTRVELNETAAPV